MFVFGPGYFRCEGGGQLPRRAPPTETKVESGTSHSNSGTCLNLTVDSEFQRGYLRRLPTQGKVRGSRTRYDTCTCLDQSVLDMEDGDEPASGEQKQVRPDKLISWSVQRYLTYKKTHPPRTLL